MGKYAKIEIKESSNELGQCLSKQFTYKKKIRVKALICLKSGRFKTRQDLANYLDIGIRTLERWVNKYKSGGLQYLLQDKPRSKEAKFITKQIHRGLSKRIHDPSQPFKGYWEAHQWVEQEYNVEVNYFAVRRYLIKHFKSKIKSARKSHIKKDNGAAEAFLKTTSSTRTY